MSNFLRKKVRQFKLFDIKLFSYYLSNHRWSCSWLVGGLLLLHSPACWAWLPLPLLLLLLAKLFSWCQASRPTEVLRLDTLPSRVTRLTLHREFDFTPGDYLQVGREVPSLEKLR